jgi:DNA-binding PadR family transcriptional regulator
MNRRVFGHGALRLYLLSLLEEGPRHGYDLIRSMEDRFLGLYTPSAGTIYPRLAALEDDGLVTHEEVDGRKQYRLTDDGRDELEARRAEIDDLVSEATRAARNLAREVRDDVRASVRDLRTELKEAVRDVRKEERRKHRQSQSDLRDVVRTLRGDLEAFVTDVVAAARQHNLDAERVKAVREALLDARQAVGDALAGRPPPNPD